MHNGPVARTTNAVLEDADLRDLLETADVGLHFTDADGIIVWANPADYRNLGYTADEYIGHHIAEFHADRALIADWLERLQAGERLTQVTARLVCRDGSSREVEITTSARFVERDGKREFRHTRCFTQDVTRRRTLEQSRDLLLQAGQALSASLDVDETLGVLSRLTVPHFADWYAVHLLDDDGSVTPIHISHVDPARTDLAWSALERWPDAIDSNSAPAITIRTGKSYLAPQVDAEVLARVSRSPDHLELLEAAGISSAMIVPLQLPEGTIGSMMFIAAESNRAYDQDDLTLAEGLANRAALAIANAQLHQQAQEARATAEQAAERLAILLKASESIAMSLQPDDALVQLARFATPILADYCVTYRMDADGSIERVGLVHSDPAMQPLVEQLVDAGPPSLGDAHGVGQVLRTGEPSLAAEVSDEFAAATAQNAEHAAVLRQLKPRSSIIVPLKARGRLLGGAAFAATELSGRRYNATDLALAEELAHRVALLVDNARLYEQGQAANRAMEEMLSIVAHDLRNPLNTIVTSSSLLTLDVPADQKQRAHDNMCRAAERMGRLLDDLLDITRIGQGRLSVFPEPTDLTTLIDELVAMHASVAAQRSIRLTRSPPGPAVGLRADPGRLIQAMSNIVDNALKFTPCGGEVSVRVEGNEGIARVCVADTGPGIKPEDLPRVFDRFWRSNGDSPEGLGLGLSIAKGIVEAHGGRIDVASTAAGTRFSIELPEIPSRQESPPCGGL